MSPTIPRDTVEGRAYNDLRNLAKRNGRDPAEYYTLYALEGFLTRLAQSKYGNELVLKGGVLMAAYSERRPTRDIDLSVANLPNDAQSCERRIRSILAIKRKDGLVFNLDGVRGEIIRDESDYSGIRVHVSACLASAELSFHVDMNFGDPINPKPTTTALPLLLGGKIEVMAYPLAMILAEKIVTAIDRGAANTRWRDFLDVMRIAESQAIDGDGLVIALGTVSTYRSVELRLLSGVLEGMAATAQAKWGIWRRKQRIESESPEKFSDLLSFVTRFADPAIEGRTVGLTWSPGNKSWSSMK
jgi:predicted nucleotidyltransferase component of viral defense system